MRAFVQNVPKNPTRVLTLRLAAKTDKQSSIRIDQMLITIGQLEEDCLKSGPWIYWKHGDFCSRGREK